MPKISVIVPVYNVEKYLDRCLQSIINQTFKDIEIICINDGSPDNSLEILEKYAAIDSRIIIINQENKGLSGARNTGIAKATGEYISFIDSDDYINLDTYEKLINILNNYPQIDLIHFGQKTFGENIAPSKKNKYYTIKYSGLKKAKDKYFLNQDISALNKIFKRKTIIDFNIKFPEKLHYEDFSFCWKYYLHCKKVYYLNEYLYNYYRRPDSIMGQTFQNASDKILDHLLAFKDVKIYYQKQDYLQNKNKILEKIFLYCFDFVCYFQGNNSDEAILALSQDVLSGIKPTNKRIKAIFDNDLYKAKNNKKFYQKIFQIYNEKIHKVYNICGLKIKLQKTLTLNNKPKILVHLHIYYQDQINYFIKKLNNINNCEWDLIVTVCENNKEIINKIRDFKPEAQIFITENKGYDILPFIHVLNKTNLNQYNYILKLHTKSFRKKSNFGKNYAWRNYLVDALLKNPERFYRNLCLLEQAPDAALIASAITLCNMGNVQPEDTNLFEEFCQKYNLSLSKGKFVSGTMFLVKANCLKFIKNLKLTSDNFNDFQQTNGSGSLAHVLERVFTRIIESQGYKIYSITDKKYKLSQILRTNLQKIFAIRNEIIDNSKHKVLILFGLKIHLN